MATKDWLDGWSHRCAHLLAEAETADVRGGLVDTNGDGRELWFGLEVLEPTGDWSMAMDWDDVGHYQPVERRSEVGVVIGWGTDQPGRRKIFTHGGQEFAVCVGSNGWWLLVASIPYVG